MYVRQNSEQGHLFVVSLNTSEVKIMEKIAKGLDRTNQRVLHDVLVWVFKRWEKKVS